MWNWLRWVWPADESSLPWAASSYSAPSLASSKSAGTDPSSKSPASAAAAGADGSLHAAALTGDVVMLRERLLRADADVNARDEQKSTPLHLAAKNGHGACVELLLRGGGCGNGGACGRYGGGFSSRKARLDLRDRWGRTALHSSVVWHQLGIASQLLRSCEHAARVKDDEGKTALHVACAMGLAPSFLDELLSCGADVNALDMRQWTPLMCAIAVQNYAVAEFLLLRGRADPNAPSPERASTTALRLAVEKCSLPLVLLLLRHGARVDAGSASGDGGFTTGRAAVSCRRAASSEGNLQPPSAVAAAAGSSRRKKGDAKNMATFSLVHASESRQSASLHIAAAVLHAGAAEPDWDALYRFYALRVRASHHAAQVGSSAGDDYRLAKYVVELSVGAGLDVSREAVQRAQRQYRLTPEADGWLLGVLNRQRLKSLRHLAALTVRDVVRDSNVGNLTTALMATDQSRLVADLVSLRHM